MKRAKKHRKRHLLPGPAGVRQQRILHQKSSKSPSSSFQEDFDDDDDDGANAPLHLQLKKQRAEQRATATHTQIWDAMCLSLDRILPSNLNLNLNYNSHHGQHKNNSRSWLRQALGVEYSLLSDLEHFPTLHIRQIVVQIDAIHPHGHLDYTVDLVDESSSSISIGVSGSNSGQNHIHNFSPEIGWLGEDLVRHHPEWIKPGAVWLCHDVSIAVFKKNDHDSGGNFANVAQIMDQPSTSNQLNGSSGNGSHNHNHASMDRMLVINEENVIFVWTEDDAKHVSHKDYIQLLERRAEVEGRIRAAYAAADDEDECVSKGEDHSDAVDMEDYSEEEEDPHEKDVAEIVGTRDAVSERMRINDQRGGERDYNNIPKSTECRLVNDPPNPGQGHQSLVPKNGIQGWKEPQTGTQQNKNTQSDLTNPNRTKVRNPYARSIPVQVTKPSVRREIVVSEEEDVEVIETINRSEGAGKDIMDDPANHEQTERASPKNPHRPPTNTQTSVQNPYARERAGTNMQRTCSLNKKAQKSTNGVGQTNPTRLRQAVPSIFSTLGDTPMQPGDMDAFDEEEEADVEERNDAGEQNSLTDNDIAGNMRTSHAAVRNPYKRGPARSPKATVAMTSNDTPSTSTSASASIGTTEANTSNKMTGVRNPYARRTRQDKSTKKDIPQAVSLTPNENADMERKSPSQALLEQPPPKGIASVFSILDHTPMSDNDIDAFDEEDGEEW